MPQFSAICEASVQQRVVMGPRTGHKVRRLIDDLLGVALTRHQAHAGKFGGGIQNPCYKDGACGGTVTETQESGIDVGVDFILKMGFFNKMSVSTTYKLPDCKDEDSGDDDDSSDSDGDDDDGTTDE